MKSKEFEKIIDSSYNKEMQAIYDNLKKKLNVPDDSVSAPAEIRNTESPSAVTAAAKQAAKPAQKPASKRRQSFKNFFKQPARLAACVSAAVAIVCVAIMLPFTLKGGNGLQATTPSTSDNPSITDDRFCAAATCKEIELSYSLKEYSARNNLSLLYVDWYDKAEIKTSLHVNKEDSNDIVYYEEILKHKSRGSIVELYITDTRTRVDKVEFYKKDCRYVYFTKRPNVFVAWGYDTNEKGEHDTYTAILPYGNRIYVLVLRYPIYENDIFELIDSMLPKI
ncbi:MAG: hypothetical protein J1F61_05730 [Clostridiales bacterium]|nr:hypothetical protein [Clostridiales bacterium]